MGGCLKSCHAESGPLVRQRSISDEFCVRLFASLRVTYKFWDSPPPNRNLINMTFTHLTSLAGTLERLEMGM